MHTNHLALAPIRTVTLSVAAALMLVTALPSAHAQAESSAPSSTSSGLTRAEVVADLRLWQRAGVDRFADLQEYGLQTEAYQRPGRVPTAEERPGVRRGGRPHQG